jgi:Fe-S-cluster containining protein
VRLLKHTRPIVRSFAARFIREAGAHVRAGGHAVVWEEPSARGSLRARLVFRTPTNEDEDLGVWAVLDLGRRRWRTASAGPLRGLAFIHVPKDALDIVRGWATRDSVHRGARRTIELDCATCAACCVHNRVELERADVRRLERGGRADLLGRPWTRRDDGKVVLVLRKDGRCKHLQEDKACGIYALRPDACSAFPPASECCLFARQEELDVVDGVRA